MLMYTGTDMSRFAQYIKYLERQQENHPELYVSDGVDVGKKLWQVTLNY